MHYHRLVALCSLVPYSTLGSPLNEREVHAREDSPSLKFYHSDEEYVLAKRHGPEAHISLPIGQPSIIDGLPQQQSQEPMILGKAPLPRPIVQQESKKGILVQPGRNAQVLPLSTPPPETTISYGGKRFKCMKRIGSSPVARPVMTIGKQVLSHLPISHHPPMPQLPMEQMQKDILVGDELFSTGGNSGATGSNLPADCDR